MSKGKDDFWDLEKLLPNKPKRVQPSAPVRISTVEISFGEEELQPARKLSEALAKAPSEPVPVVSYQPDWNPLILGVKVLRRPATYRFHRQFYVQAKEFLHTVSAPCAYVPFFSCTPQYIHMDAEQRQYYFYWRDCVRREEYPKCDMGYLTLYLYELINLPDLIPPKEGVLLMAKVWLAYAADLPKIHPYLVSWMADYCLVHELPCPFALLSPLLPQILLSSGLKEFYLGGTADLSDCKINALLALASDYRWEEGRYAKGEHAALFRQHMPCAAGLVVERLFQKGMAEKGYCKLKRCFEAFGGALCAYPVRCMLEVEYYPVSHTQTMRRILTSAVKYAENRLRAHLSIKSRLSVTFLEEEYKSLIDGYFQQSLPNKQTAKEPAPAYEARYEALSSGFSPEDAKRIEDLSWENTRLLVTEDVQEEVTAPGGSLLSEVVEPLENSCSVPDEKNEQKSVIPYLQAVEALVLADRNGLFQCARARGISVEALCGEINELFYDEIGDAVLENTDGGFVPVEDYREDLLQWIEAQKTE